MLKIRLQRVGRKNDPSFRIVLTDSKNATRSNKFHEILGSYDSRKGEPVIKEDRVKYWMSVGAKPSGTVHNILVEKKIITGKKLNVLSKKSPIRPESAKAEETAPEA
jgi:small subunit ribosomal protein S16